jgi:LmbE family N-acetylglucosaminyl deacetylase
MIAAHPDDENTAVLAYFARGRHMETSYLSLTRGEGGQNLIGSEQGDKLGVIRTQELLAARRIDGAHQYFTRAIDFGFTKTVDETLSKWGGRETVLADVVWTIRRLRPDVIFLRFSGTPRDGHGQHQTSAILGKEAFNAAADPARFPDQLKWVQPWQAKRLLWNVFSFTPEQEKEAAKMGGRIGVDVGEYNPVLGFSYGEIAGMSRSMHRTQAMGSAERRGSMPQWFVVVEGAPAGKDPFDGIDTSWSRAGGKAVEDLLAQAERDFTPEHPEAVIPTLVKARAAAASLNDPWAKKKMPEFDEAIALCAGIAVEAIAERPSAVPGSKLNIAVNAINRSKARVRWDGLAWDGAAAARPVEQSPAAALTDNVQTTRRVEWSIAADQSYTEPYWLAKQRPGDTYVVDSQTLIGLPENPPVLEAVFLLNVDGAPVTLKRPVSNRYVDRARGELTRPFNVVPAVSIGMPETAVVFASGSGRRIEVPVRSNAGAQSGTLTLTAPDGWRIDPAQAEFSLAQGEQKVLAFNVTAPKGGDAKTVLTASVNVSGRVIANGMDVIDYEHIPPQTLFPPSKSKAVATAVKNLATRVGYVAGAGDEVPQSLKQIGCEVTLLWADDLARADLSRFDAIVTGVRAWNVRSDLRANRQRLLDYMQNGGTLVVQYNVLEGGFGGGDPRQLDGIGPYPIRISRDRVTVEDAPVKFTNPANPLLETPNTIKPADFEGWVQERGLYFAAEWDPKYQTLFESHDPGEKPLEGGTLVARYGKGAYVFTAYSWFRQLPAGVPGAYRIFANFLSAGKVLANVR